jgi:hypothetical protein
MGCNCCELLFCLQGTSGAGGSTGAGSSRVSSSSARTSDVRRSTPVLSSTGRGGGDDEDDSLFPKARGLIKKEMNKASSFRETSKKGKGNA